MRTDIRPENLMKKYHVKYFQLSPKQMRALSRKSQGSKQSSTSGLNSPKKHVQVKGTLESNQAVLNHASTKHQFDSSAMNSLRHRIDKIYSKFFKSANYNELLKFKLQTYRETPWRTSRDNYSSRWKEGVKKSTNLTEAENLETLDIAMKKATLDKSKVLVEAPLKPSEKIVTRSSVMKVENNIVTRPIKKIFKEQKTDLYLIPEKTSNLEDQLLERRMKEDVLNRKKLRKQGILISNKSNDQKSVTSQLKLLTQMISRTSQATNIKPIVRQDSSQKPGSPFRPTLVHSMSMTLVNDSEKTLNDTNTEAVSQFKTRSQRFHNLIDEKIEVLGAKSESELLSCLNTLYYSRQMKTRKEKSDKKILSQRLPRPKQVKVKETRKQIRQIKVFSGGYFVRRGSAPDKMEGGNQLKKGPGKSNFMEEGSLKEEMVEKGNKKKGSNGPAEPQERFSIRSFRRDSLKVSPEKKFIFNSAGKTGKKIKIL